MEKNQKEWVFRKVEALNFDERNYFLDHERRYFEYKKIIDTLPSIKNVCDIGIGTGIFYKIFSNENINVSGVDIVEEYVDICRQRGIDARLCDINKEKLPFPDQSFDLVICDSILEHSLSPNLLAQEAMRLVCPGGYIIFTTPNAMSFTRRWGYLVGRNPFSPMINNLVEELGYLRRCSIFYGPEEIKKIFPGKKVKVFYIWEDFYRGRKSSIVISLINLLTKFIHSGREVLAVIVN